MFKPTFTREEYNSYFKVNGSLDEVCERYIKYRNSIDSGFHYPKRGWINFCIGGADYITVKYEVYAGCGDYEYERIEVPIDHLFMEEDELRAIFEKEAKEKIERERIEKEERERQTKEAQESAKKAAEEMEYQLYKNLKAKYETK